NYKEIQTNRNVSPGRQAPEYDADQIREVFFGPYRIIYHIKKDQIDVLAVVHGAMNLLQDEEE
ncbi:MAG: type II toxin-antitoxin system RelE/ParE family toxin, partial [Nitrospira sp.]|nr:type II toxin-antitoxin system RelE/ParE family toxin [Nitrospira sp.]